MSPRPAGSCGHQVFRSRSDHFYSSGHAPRDREAVHRVRLDEQVRRCAISCASQCSLSGIFAILPVRDGECSEEAARTRSIVARSLTETRLTRNEARSSPLNEGLGEGNTGEENENEK